MSTASKYRQTRKLGLCVTCGAKAKKKGGVIFSRCAACLRDNADRIRQARDAAPGKRRG